MSAQRPFKSSRRSIKYDRVQAHHFLEGMPSSCEDCSHFHSSKEYCTLGYNTPPHRKLQQQKDYVLTGHIAFCRFLEID